MVKAKKDCGFNYLLSHKAVGQGSEEKKYIGTLKCLTHTHELHLTPFSFKVHEKSTVEYQVLVVQARKYRIGKVSYAESQQLLYYTKGREEKSARGRTRRLNLRRQAGWQSRNLANEGSGVIGLGLFRAKPYLEIFGVGCQ
jgi:hypothetical protein